MEASGPAASAAQGATNTS